MYPAYLMLQLSLPIINYFVWSCVLQIVAFRHSITMKTIVAREITAWNLTKNVNV